MTLADIDRWNLDDFTEMARAANQNAVSSTDTAINLQTIIDTLAWTGAAAEAARHSHAHLHADLLDDARRWRLVADTLSWAKLEVEIIKAAWARCQRQATLWKLVISPENATVIPMPTVLTVDGQRELNKHKAIIEAGIRAILAAANTLDEQIATMIDVASGEISIEEGARRLGQEGLPRSIEPTITAADTTATREDYNDVTGQQDDLGATIPGTGIALGGDGATGPPIIRIPAQGDAAGFDGPNPVPVRMNPDGKQAERALPTGTAVGPNGEHYGLYGIVPYNKPDGSKNDTFSVPDTIVVNLDHPAQVLYTLHGISQASGAFDKTTGRMVIVGNTPDGTRAMWTSAPVTQNPDWANTLTQRGTFTGAMNGGRENQIVALPQGGFLLVGADEQYSPSLRHTVATPIEAVVARTPDGLLTATPTPVLPPNGVPPEGGPYGPSIVSIEERNGQEVVTMRTSTYGPGYNPHTYYSRFTITPGLWPR